MVFPDPGSTLPSPSWSNAETNEEVGVRARGIFHTSPPVQPSVGLPTPVVSTRDPPRHGA